MSPNFSKLLPGIFLVAATLAAYSTTMQTTSGRDWLGANPNSGLSGEGWEGSDRSNINQRVIEAASVEPILQFPARIGLAKIGPIERNGQRVGLVSPKTAEAEAWSDAAQRLGAGFGKVVPISPLIAAMLEPQRHEAAAVSTAREVMEAIRLAAAGQHLDAVIVYETDATTDTRNTPLSIADWILIGAIILPSQGSQRPRRGASNVVGCMQWVSLWDRASQRRR